MVIRAVRAGEEGSGQDAFIEYNRHTCNMEGRCGGASKQRSGTYMASAGSLSQIDPELHSCVPARFASPQASELSNPPCSNFRLTTAG